MDMLTLSKNEKRGGAAVIVAAVVAIMAGIFLCGRASAATLEARVGDRDGATFGLAVTSTVEKADVGVVLEFGEADSVSLVGRIAKVWPGRVSPYVAFGAGIGIEEETTVETFHPQYQVLHAFQFEQTTREAGLVAEAVGGIRGTFRPGLGWFVEAALRDAPFGDGLGVSAGLRFGH